MRVLYFATGVIELKNGAKISYEMVSLEGGLELYKQSIINGIINYYKIEINKQNISLLVPYCNNYFILNKFLILNPQ